VRGNRWIALVAAVLIATYAGCMLLVPALPIAGPGGEVSRISRAEFWMILVASFETIWNQWTSGQPPTISDRFPKIACATAWLALCAVLGYPIVRGDRLTNKVNRLSALAWSIAIGSSIASLCVAGNGMTFGPQSRLGLIGWLSGVGLALHLCFRRFAIRQEETVDGGQTSLEATDTETYDPSLNDSWARRLMGLTSLGIVWLLILTVLGACLPTYDADVREHRIMATRIIYLENQLMRIDHQREANVPQGTMMPGLFWMNMFVGRPPDLLNEEAVQGMVDSALVCQIVQGIYWCIAIWILIGSLARSYGTFAAVLAGFALASLPGFFELVRLGGGAGEGGMVLVAAASLLLLQHRVHEIPCGSLVCIAAGAAGLGWVMFLLVTVPVAIRLTTIPSLGSLRRTCLLIFSAAVAMFWGGAVVGQFVDAGLFRGRAGGVEQAFLSQYLPFFFSPWSGVGEGAWDAFMRMLFFSTVHSLHLIPIAILGLAFERHRAGRDAGIWFGVWCLLWWMMTPQQDRDWVLAMPLLAWPMASGIAWLSERGQRVLLIAICGISLAWSIIALCAWPTSDNRLLVPLESLATIISEEDAEQGRGVRFDMAPSVNRIWNRLDRERKNDPWLLLGSADAFRWLPNVELYGTYDTNPWEELVEKWDTHLDPVRDFRSLILKNQIGHLVLDWQGFMFRDQLLGTQREPRCRNAIQMLQQMGVLKRVEWDFDSSRAECYEVVDSPSSNPLLSPNGDPRL
jgi:hypothetical protein